MIAMISLLHGMEISLTYCTMQYLGDKKKHELGTLLWNSLLWWLIQWPHNHTKIQQRFKQVFKNLCTVHTSSMAADWKTWSGFSTEVYSPMWDFFFTKCCTERTKIMLHLQKITKFITHCCDNKPLVLKLYVWCIFIHCTVTNVLLSWKCCNLNIHVKVHPNWFFSLKGNECGSQWMNKKIAWDSPLHDVKKHHTLDELRCWLFYLWGYPGKKLQKDSEM